jgi:hypothetical protein
MRQLAQGRPPLGPTCMNQGMPIFCMKRGDQNPATNNARVISGYGRERLTPITLLALLIRRHRSPCHRRLLSYYGQERPLRYMKPLIDLAPRSTRPNRQLVKDQSPGRALTPSLPPRRRCAPPSPPPRPQRLPPLLLWRGREGQAVVASPGGHRRTPVEDITKRGR